MKTAAIVFTDEWLPYAPTVLNLKTCLQEAGYSTKIFTLRSGFFGAFDQVQGDVSSFYIPLVLQKILRRLGLYSLLKFHLFKLFFGRKIGRADLCFTVDSLGYVAASSYHSHPIYVSLEVVKDSWFAKALRIGIREVLIQSRERFDFLFQDVETSKKPNFFLLPNSPFFFGSFEEKSPRKKDLIFLGYISASHGVEACIQSLRSLPETYRLTMKGPVRSEYRSDLLEKNKDLVSSGRLIMDDTYIPQENLNSFLRQFFVGFCFYDFDLLEKNDFNYLSCPSGKLYNYFGAGVPVVGSDILGLQTVKEEDCGFLVKTPEPTAVAAAVEEIAKNWEEKSKNAQKAAEKFDFRRHFQNFLKTIS